MIREERNALVLLLTFLAGAGILYFVILRPALREATHTAPEQTARRQAEAAERAANEPPADARPKTARRLVSLRGAVVDAASGRALPGAQVRVVGIEDIAEPTVVLDPSGLLAIDFLPPAISFGLMVADEGHRPLTFARLREEAGRIVDLGVVALEPMRSVRGTVRGADGRPVAGCAVTMHLVDDPAPSFAIDEAAHLAVALLTAPAAAAVTDGDGRFEIAELPAQRHAAAFSAEGLAGLAGTVLPDVDLRDGNRQLDITLQPGIAGGVQLAFADGRPAAGAQVLLLEDAHPLARRAFALGTCDGGGSFRAAAFLPAPAFVFVTGGGAAARGFGPIWPTAPTDAPWSIAEGRPLAGVAHDEAQRPVPQAAVVARPDGPDGAEPPGALPVRTATGTDGRFQLDGLAEGTVALRTAAPGLAPDLRHVTTGTPGADTEVAVTLLAGGRARGVVAAAGTPVPFAPVAVLADRNDHDRRTLADAAGRFVLDALAPGPQTLRVAPPGHAAAHVGVEIENGADREVAVAVSPGGELHLLARDAALVPVAGATVTAVPLAAEDPERLDFSGARSASTDPLGEATLHQLGAARVVLLATGPPHAPASSEPVEPSAENLRARIALTLPKGGSLAGIVRGEDGAPRPAVLVRLAGAPGTPFAPLTGALLALAGAAAVTAADGSFSIGPVPQGNYRLEIVAADARLAAPADVVVRDDTRRADLEIEVVSSAPVTGRVLDAAGNAAAYAVVDLEREGRPPASAVTDAAGRFVFAAQEPPFALAARGAGGTAARLEIAANAGSYELRLGERRP